jgi:RHS repeat-associated protein
MDPNGNSTVINFAEDGYTTAPTYNLYETQRRVNQLNGGTQTLLATAIKCYNKNYAACATATVSSPITQTDAYSELANNSTRLSEIVYNTYGLITDDKEYNYGVTMGAAPGNTDLIRETATVYASLGNGIVNEPSSVTVYDWTSGTKTELASTAYAYDQGTPSGTSGTPQHVSVTGSRGLLTTVAFSTSSTASLSKTFTYYDTGNPNVLTDVNGAQTTFLYSSAGNPYNTALTASCGNSFATTINEPLSLSQSIQWNCIGGLAEQTTDENGQKVKSTYSDAYFWRPASIYDQENNETTIAYSGQTAVEAAIDFNNNSKGASQSVSDVRTTVDGFGRPILNQRLQGPSAGNYDTTETDYNNLGQPYRNTMPFSAAAGGTSSTAPASNTTYDALGRVLSVIDADNGTVSSKYTNNDVLQQVSGGSNTQTFQKQLEYDGLGRLTSVCELSTTLTGIGTCGQSTTQSGVWTKYTYDALGRLLTVTQNAQTSGSQQSRSYNYDLLGRLTSESNPETGTFTYAYDTVPVGCYNSGASYAGNLVAVTKNGTITTCPAYDALGRLHYVTAQGYCQRFSYDDHTYWGWLSAPGTISNGAGRLTEVETDNCTGNVGTQITDEWFSYSPRGELTDVYESTPNSIGYYHAGAAYWPTGTLNSLSAFNSASTALFPTIYYGASGAGLDGEGRITQVTAASGTAPVTAVTYSPTSNVNPLGSLTAVTFGSADSDGFTYDPNTGRMATYSFSVNSQTDAGTLTWSPNGTLSKLAINDQITGTSDSQTCSYSYDDLQRLSSGNCGVLWTQNFTYDSFGNITKAGSSAFAPTYSFTTNQFTAIPGRSVKYDTNGNLLTDNLNSYTWDAYGNMSTVNTGSATVTATYDALGRMVENNAGGKYIQIIYGPNGKKLATATGQTLVKAFIALPGGAKAIYNSTGLAYYRHPDWLGSSRLTSTAPKSTSMYSSTAYAPFGEVQMNQTSGTADASFTGQDQDTASNLYDFTFRRYSPSQGRWISPDPLGRGAVRLTNPQSWNRYAYVKNNPLALTDPAGLVDCAGDCGGDDGGGVGGGDDAGLGDDNTGCDATVCTTITVTADPPDDVPELDSQVNPCTGIFGGVNNDPGDPGFDEAAAETNGETVFPLPGHGKLNLALNVASVGTRDNINVGYVVSAINSMYMSGSTNMTLYFFSGSAGLAQQALGSPDLNAAALAAISQVFFIEPGGLMGPNVRGLPAQTFIGTGALDKAVQWSNSGPWGIPSYPGGQPIKINAPHSFQLAWNTPQVQATVPVSTPCE